MLDPKHIPYHKDTLFKIDSVVYEIMVRHRYYRHPHDCYRYEMRKHNDTEVQPFLVEHEYLYNVDKETAGKETKPSNRWR